MAIWKPDEEARLIEELGQGLKARKNNWSHSVASTTYGGSILTVRKFVRFRNF